MRDSLVKQPEIRRQRKGPLARSRYGHGLVPWTVILSALAWIAFWLLWPRCGSSAIWRTMPPLYSRVAYVELGRDTDFPYIYMRPDMFVHGESDNIALDSDMGEGDGPRSTRFAPRFLETQPALERLTLAPYLALADRMVVCRRYDPALAWTPAFAPSRISQTNLTVWISESLRQCGFSLEAVSTTELWRTGKSWQVEALVEIGSDGRPENVLLLNGTDDSSLNRRIVAAIESGRVEKTGKTCAGHVVMSFGTP